jgi:hypothetical protein
MRACDLTGSEARLTLAAKTLTKAIEDADSHWSDETNRRFHDTYFRPLDASLRDALQAIRALREVLAAAEHECGPV